jgi:hypothetical protein
MEGRREKGREEGNLGRKERRKEGRKESIQNPVLFFPLLFNIFNIFLFVSKRQLEQEKKHSGEQRSPYLWYFVINHCLKSL